MLKFQTHTYKIKAKGHGLGGVRMILTNAHQIPTSTKSFLGNKHLGFDPEIKITLLKN